MDLVGSFLSKILLFSDFRIINSDIRNKRVKRKICITLPYFDHNETKKLKQRIRFLSKARRLFKERAFTGHFTKKIWRQKFLISNNCEYSTLILKLGR